jgi:hypothetical protein
MGTGRRATEDTPHDIPWIALPERLSTHLCIYRYRQRGQRAGGGAPGRSDGSATRRADAAVGSRGVRSSGTCVGFGPVRECRVRGGFGGLRRGNASAPAQTVSNAPATINRVIALAGSPQWRITC